MITWLPQISYAASAARLDDERLGRQIDSCVTFLDVMDDPAEFEMENAPEYLMWRDHQCAFVMYAIKMVMESRKRKIESWNIKVFHDYMRDLKNMGMPTTVPPWSRDANIIRSHRSRLMSLGPTHYGPQFPGTPLSMPILWPQPVTSDPRGYRLRITMHDLQLLNSGKRQLPEWLYYNPSANEIVERKIKNA